MTPDDMFVYREVKSAAHRFCAAAMMVLWVGALVAAPRSACGIDHRRAVTVSGVKLPPFPVFDAGQSKAKKLGWSQPAVTKIQLIYADRLWPKKDRPDGPEHPIDAAYVQKFAKQLNPHELVCIDIEEWKVWTKSGLEKYEHMADLIHQANPHVKLGYYGVLPIRNYPAALQPNSVAYKQWVAANKRLVVLAKHVDVIFPSLYTFYNAPKQWQQYAIANIQQAKQYGKPVYPYIWPLYHLMATRKKSTLIAGDFWRLQLQTCYEHADGLVIWNGGRDKLSNDQGWAKVTREFLAKIDGQKK